MKIKVTALAALLFCQGCGPLVSDEFKAEMEKKPEHKAIAAQPAPWWTWVFAGQWAHGSAWGATTGEEAMTRAMAACEARRKAIHVLAHDAPCQPYSIDGVRVKHKPAP